MSSFLILVLRGAKTRIRYRVPSVEEALLAPFKRGKNAHIRTAELVFCDSIAQSRQGMVLWWKQVENCDVLRLVCKDSVTSVENYLSWIAGAKKTQRLPPAIVDALIRDVLPLPNYGTLDDIAGAIVAFRTTIADVLSVEPRQHEAPVWKPYVTGAGSWWTTIWLRLNLATALCPASEKLDRFLAAHQPCVAYLDSLPDRGLDDQTLDHRHLVSLYVSAGASTDDQDRRLVKMYRVKLRGRATPLEVIEAAFPFESWIVEAVIAGLERGTYRVPSAVWNKLPVAIQATAGNYKVYIASLCICHQCETLAKDPTTSQGVQDALYLYYLAFLDFFCLSRFDDAYLLTESTFAGLITPWQQTYPVDTRAFCADDLPNLYHVLMGVPFYGQQSEAGFLIAKYFQKCQPYSGQRRSLLALTVESLQGNEPFRVLFGQIMWCMLANTYPGQPVTSRQFDWDYLRRCKALTLDGGMQRALAEPGDTKACALILTAFRLYMHHMMEPNVHMMKLARVFIADFDKARDMAQTIRTSNLFPDDAFARARMLLARVKKSASAKVNRYKKSSCAGTLLHCFNSELESEVFWLLNQFRQHCADLANCPLDQVVSRFGPACKTGFRGKFFAHGGTVTADEVAAALEHGRQLCQALDVGPDELWNKQNILNALIRMPEADRLSAKGLSLLTLPEYGGLLDQDVTIVMNMVAIYYKARPMPKEYEQQMEGISTVGRFKAITWYLNVVVLLEKIRLTPHDHDTAMQIQRAMMERRYAQVHVQNLDSSVYDVYLSLCCKTVKTLLGKQQFGQRCVSYNTSMGCFVCSKNDGKSAPRKRAAKRAALEHADDNEEEQEDQEEEEDDEELHLHDVDAIIEQEMHAHESTSASLPGQVKYQRKDFHFIPCGKQPVLVLNLLGYSLVYGNTRYRHCVSCASLFRQPVAQMAKQCATCTATVDKNYCFTCAFCAISVAPAQAAHQTLTVRCSLRDSADAQFSPLKRGDAMVQHLYFCKQHHALARHQVGNMDKPELFAHLARNAKRKLRVKISNL